MKKMMAAFLAFAMLASQTAFAATDTSQMQEALLSVKAKIDIPAELTNFESSTSEYDDGTVSYSFSWNNEDYTKRINVYSDQEGHIHSMNRYDNAWYQNSGDAPRLYDYSKDEIAAFAENYLRRVAPEAFADANDALQYDEQASAGSLDSSPSFYVQFQRVKDGVAVQENSASVNIRLLPSELVVQSFNLDWNYDKSFESLDGVISAADAAEAYKTAFPLELVYRKYGTTDDSAILLEYKLNSADTNYIDAKTGTQVTRDERDAAKYAGSSGGGSANSAVRDEEAAMPTLSPAEQEELTNVAGLKSADEIIATVKTMEELALPADMAVLSSNLYKTDDAYFYQISMQNSDEDNGGRYLHITANAKTGLVTSLSSNGFIIRNESAERTQLTEEQIAAYRAKAEGFLKTHYAEQFADAAAREEEYSVTPVYYTNDILYFSYARQIDGIPYVSNTISVSWDTENDRLYSFSLNWDDSVADAPDSASAIDADAAYNTILENDPVSLLYVSVDGVYKPVYAINGGNTTVNAISGALIDYDGEPAVTDENAAYTDIDGHWVADMVNALGNFGIRLEGSAFRPDSEITQGDYMRLIYATMNNGYLYKTSEDDIYSRLIEMGILSESEKAPASTVKKEDAIKYLLRTMGIKEVAELQGIYICDFADAADISPANLGYCAIAKGFGIASGSDGMLYPQKSITRAEAITLLYQYLTR